MDHLDYFDAESVSLEQLEFIASNISMEAFASPTFMIDAKKRFSQFFSGVGNYFSKLNLANLSALRPLPNDIEGFVVRVGYMNAADKEIIVPEGFIGKWEAYSNDIKAAMQKAIKLEAAVLALNDTIGSVINNPDLMTNASGIGHNSSTDLGISSAVKELGNKHYDPKSNSIRRSLGAVVERAQDIKATKTNLADAIALDKAHPAIKVKKAIERVMELAPRLSDAIDNNPRVAKTAVTELVDLTLTMAREVEAYGVLLFRITQFSNALNDSIKELKKP